LIKIVFTFEKSIPFSITVVANNISYSLFLNESILFSNWSPANCPWAIIIFFQGNILARLIF
jgi:hypothetical protein